MIVADIISNLGNQLFIYAATKSVALDLGYQYRYRVVKPSFAPSNNCIDVYGHEYRDDFERLLSGIDIAERVFDLPSNISNSWVWERTVCSSFNRGVYDIGDDTLLQGYFLSPAYFEHRSQDVLKWFSFNPELRSLCIQKRNEISKLTGASHLISVHVRLGKDYRYWRLSLDPSYYNHAYHKIKESFSQEKLHFLLFTDVPDEARRSLKINNMTTIHGNMFDDLCLMTLCDGHIVSNSTFAWWGAWLSNSKIVIRPSIWPIAEGKLMPTDIFPSHWITVEAEREKLTPRNFFRYRIVNEYNKYTRTWITKPLVIFKKLVKKLLKVFQRALGTICN
jgi:hypothetical protein